MYVCICNAISERRFADVIDAQTTSVHEAFRRCGERPQCGKCLNHVAEIIDDARANHLSEKLAAE